MDIPSDSQTWPLTRGVSQDSPEVTVSESRHKWHKIKGALFPCVAIGAILSLVTALFIFSQYALRTDSEDRPCQEKCSFTLVSSVSQGHMLTTLLRSAKHSVKILAINPANLTLERSWVVSSISGRNNKKKPSLVVLLGSPKVNSQQKIQGVNLTAFEDAEIRGFSLSNSTIYSQFVIIDDSSFYLINDRFQSLLRQTPPLGGLLVSDCSCIATSLTQVMDMYYKSVTQPTLANRAKNSWYFTEGIPNSVNKPLHLQSENGADRGLYYLVAVSPLRWPKIRQNELSALFDIINSSANKFIYISHGRYDPGVSINQDTAKRYWPTIDNVLRRVVYETDTAIKVLSHDDENICLMSECSIQIQSIQQRRGADSPRTCYAVTDTSLYFGTCDWDGDYFLSDRLSINLIAKNISTSSYPRLDNTTHIDFREQLAGYFEQMWADTEIDG